MSAFEHVTPEGFRLDGRKLGETRLLRCTVGSAAIGGAGLGSALGGGGAEADGCAMFELGNTKAVAYVYGPMEMRRAQSQHDRATLTCALSTASFGTSVRYGRGTRGGDRHATERSNWIQQTFESAIMLQAYPRSQIKLFVHILQAEGAGVAAAINAASLALADAGIPMKDTVCACTAGILGRRVAIDLTREEEMAGGAQVIAGILAGTQEVSLLEVESKVPEGMFAPMYEAAVAGCAQIAMEMKACLLEHATQSFSLRMSLRSGQKH
mmetsp:Transcript_15148/g.32682  ORF Transcript_15148/g.32682 Transcript_15148/m.32682 type:complete len:268 (+) Transcript_15148:177-980(+)|eukprot:CAMPEP_0206547064 /NCGR_PEP_ID=MMETSP0325_2-20121206/13084_1 /ASSEMBLY_ACC=CAM_ASM_000347 /TAXON_ID=2866 /ORGANISM="Crypthecodinium cohnii, Strain Seligo" /LENGTH=267 /DNA_ID=CAMNT_0054046319 /DNA_START=88 /DNA_END=891 /DNA_ORIENTATION=+